MVSRILVLVICLAGAIVIWPITGAFLLMWVAGILVCPLNAWMESVICQKPIDPVLREDWLEWLTLPAWPFIWAFTGKSGPYMRSHGPVLSGRE